MELDLETYNPMDPEIQQNPFPSYAALRKQAPVLQHPRTGIFFVSRMDAVSEVLRKHSIYSSQIFSVSALPPVPGFEEEMEAIRSEGWESVDTMLTADPPIQSRYRKAVGRAFTTKRIKSLEPSIRALTDELIDAWPDKGRIDFLRDFSVPLPIRVISRFLSISPEREKDVKRWSDDSVAGLGVKLSGERAVEVTRSIVELQKFHAANIEERRNRPQDDFLSELVATVFEDMDGRERDLEMGEMLSIVQQLMVAGNETTTKGINEIMKLLIENPAEWKRMKEDPSIIPALIEEGLRLASPNQGLFRRAKEDSELCGVEIPKGSLLWAMFGSANRDEQVFPDPDRFDPSRPNLNESVALGRGAHFCIGAPLARLELKVVFEQIAARVEQLAFAPGTELRYQPSFILRGLESLELDIAKGQ